MPRLALVAMLLFTRWIGNAHDGFIVPILGFLFLPYTLVWYTVVVNRFDGSWGFWQIAILALALLADISSLSGGFIFRRRKRPARRAS